MGNHGFPRQHPDLHEMKARIEIVVDFEDLKKVAEFIKAVEAHK